MFLFKNRGWNNLFQPVFGTTCPNTAKRIAALVAAILILAPTSFAIIDTNNNGVSDTWEEAHNNGNLISNLDLQADPDGDGWTNEQEAAAGTDPFDANPPNGFIRPETQHIPEIWGDDNGQPILITPESFNITWPLTTGKQYTLQFSFDLSAGSWITLDSPFIAAETVPTYYFPVADAPKRFWRVAVTDVDTDNDGLTDTEEHQIGSSPYLADTDGDGINDHTAYTSGLDPSGNDSDSDGDGVPDKDLYSVVFELQMESRTMPYTVPYESYNSADAVHRYFTQKDTEFYTVSDSPSYADITNGQHVTTRTALVNGSMTADGEPVTSATGTPFNEWKSSNSNTLGEGETSHRGTAVRSVEGPTITATQSKTITTDTTPWTVSKNNVVVRSGTEVITITDQSDLHDATTYPQFWSNHVKTRPWQELEPYKCGPLAGLMMIRAIFGDAAAAEMIRNYFRSNNFDIFGTVSDPGRDFSYYGKDFRLKNLRWRWVRFNPQSPFSYEYATPPASVSRTFLLLVSQHDHLGTYRWTGGPEVDQSTTKGIVEIVCNANQGTADWQPVPQTKFATYKLEDPTVLNNMDFSKVGYSHVHFGSLPVGIDFVSRNPLTGRLDQLGSIVEESDSRPDVKLEALTSSILSDGSLSIQIAGKARDQISELLANGNGAVNSIDVLLDGDLVTTLTTSQSSGEDVIIKSPWLRRDSTVAFSTTQNIGEVTPGDRKSVV